MDQPIMLSPQDLINMMVAACASIITISTAVTLIVKWITKAKEPEQTQNMRIEHIERRLEEVDRKLARDNERLLRMETGNYTTNSRLNAVCSIITTCLRSLMNSLIMKWSWRNCEAAIKWRS